jgi:hypothetical protein
MTRIGGIQMADLTRAEFDNATSATDFRALTNKPRLRVLQCSEPVSEDVWSLVNEQFSIARPDVEIRVYGHYATECNLTFARLLTNVRRFAADCLMKANGVEALTAMPALKSLSLGIFELNDLGVLERIPPDLTSLSLGATRSKKLSLGALSRFRQLQVLHIEGHSKDIEVLGQLQELEDLTLRSITTPDLQYLAHLPKLWSLDIKLGGIQSFRGIEGKKTIKYFELWQVRGVRNTDVIGLLPGLQNLFLQSLPHVGSFPQLRDSAVLRRIVVENLKGLHDFSALKSAPALEEFALLSGRRQNPQQLLPALSNPRIQRISAYFGTARKNNEFLNLREQYGKVELVPWEPFEYQ